MKATMKLVQVFLTLAVSFAANHYPDSCQVGWCVSDVRSIIVDVRDASEREADGSVACSGNVPFNAPAGDNRSFAQRFRAVYGDGTGYDQVFLYCRSGNRAGQAQQALSNAYKWDLAGIVNLGGWTTNNEWRECGECPADKGFPDPYAQCEAPEHGMRAITSGTGTRCASIFTRNSSGSFIYLNMDANTEESCQAACLASDECNFMTFYPSNKRCYLTPTCEVVNCAANIWKKDSVCAPEDAPDSLEEPAGPAGTVYEIDYGFQYAENSAIQVKEGDTIRWTWSGRHDVRWEDNEFNSRPGHYCDESPCEITFTKEDRGDWYYYCSVPGHRAAGQNNYKVTVRKAAWTGAVGPMGTPERSTEDNDDPCAGNPFAGKTKKQLYQDQTYKKAKKALKQKKKFEKKAKTGKKVKKWNNKIKNIKNPTVAEAEETMTQWKFAKNRCVGK